MRSTLLCLLLLALPLAASPTPAKLQEHFRRVRALGQLLACQSNCKNLVVSLQMYKMDNQDKMPANLTALSPKYMRAMPNCPAAGKSTYQLRTKGAEFLVVCVGHNHAEADIPVDYPRSSESGHSWEKPGLERGKTSEGPGREAVRLQLQGLQALAAGKTEEGLGLYQQALAKGLAQYDPLMSEEIRRFLQAVK